MEMKRNNALDFLKICATVMIVFHHYQGTTGVVFEHFNFDNGKYYFGYLVELFFMISGLFMCKYKKLDVSFSDFFVKRCIRLLPMTAIAGAVHMVRIYMSYKSFHIWGWIINALGLYSIGGEGLKAYNINPPSWYVSSLLICYLFFYFILTLYKRWNISLKWLCVAMMIIGIAIQSYAIDIPFFNDRTSRGYIAFFFGVLIGELIEKMKITKRMYVWMGLIAIGFVWVALFKYEWISSGFGYNLLFIFYPCIIVIFTSDLMKKFFHAKCIGVISEITFSVYLLHSPIYLLMDSFAEFMQIKLPIHRVEFMVGYTILTFLVGTVAYFFVEKPITKILLLKYEKYQLNKVKRI